MAFLKVFGKVSLYKGEKQLNMIHMLDVVEMPHVFSHLFEVMYSDIFFDNGLVSVNPYTLPLMLILIEAPVGEH
jgi:hypothetical protein